MRCIAPSNDTGIYLFIQYRIQVAIHDGIDQIKELLVKESKLIMWFTCGY